MQSFDEHKHKKKMKAKVVKTSIHDFFYDIL